MNTISIPGIMEIDTERGVIYFHSSEKGHSALRICGLPTPIPDPSEYGEMLDITVTPPGKQSGIEMSQPASFVSFSWR